MQYIVVSLDDDIDISAATIGAEVSLTIGDKTIAGATVQVKGQGANPTQAASELVPHTHQIGGDLTIGPTIGPAVVS
jgi:hypothetical protein